MESSPAPGSEGAEAALREHLLGGGEGPGASPAPPSTGGRSTAGSKASGGPAKAWTFASLPFPSPRPAHSAEPDQAGRVKKWGNVAKVRRPARPGLPFPFAAGVYRQRNPPPLRRRPRPRILTPAP